MGNVNHRGVQNAAMEPGREYSYADVRARLREELGVDVAESTLRAGFAEAGTPASRITAGMPTPLPGSGRNRPARFAAAAIETWLAMHPRRLQEAALDAIAASTAAERSSMVAQARALHVSWARIAAAIGAAEGRPYSRQAAFKRYSSAQQAGQDPGEDSPDRHERPERHVGVLAAAPAHHDERVDHPDQEGEHGGLPHRGPAAPAE